MMDSTRAMLGAMKNQSPSYQTDAIPERDDALWRELTHLLNVIDEVAADYLLGTLSIYEPISTTTPTPLQKLISYRSAVYALSQTNNDQCIIDRWFFYKLNLSARLEGQKDITDCCYTIINILNELFIKDKKNSYLFSKYNSAMQEFWQQQGTYVWSTPVDESTEAPAANNLMVENSRPRIGCFGRADLE